MSPSALLLDLDGTLYAGDTALPGAPAAVHALRARGIPFRYVTNTTRVSRTDIAGMLGGLGFPASADLVFTAPLAAAAWLARTGVRRIALYVPRPTWPDFAGFTLVEDAPEAVVVGDLGTGWDFATLNRAFRQVLDGARLIALQKNRYWRTETGLTLDAGAFVAALEYATDQRALVVGKPSADFFALARAALGVPAERVAVVGDDITADVAGAQAAGMLGVLVRTGKFREQDLERAERAPDRVLASAAELAELF